MKKADDNKAKILKISISPIMLSLIEKIIGEYQGRFL